MSACGAKRSETFGDILAKQDAVISHRNASSKEASPAARIPAPPSRAAGTTF
jgi:hypothetical protein